MLVLHRGAIVFEHYANGMRPETPHMLFSITKSLVGLVRRNADRRTGDRRGCERSSYVPELSRQRLRAEPPSALCSTCATVSGFDENYADPEAEIHRYSAAYWGEAEGGVRAALPRIGGAGARTPSPIARP
jgi:hypothetical protein